MPSRLGDYIVVKKKYGLVEVPRGDMTDKEWEARKTEAENNGSIVEERANGKTMKVTTGKPVMADVTTGDVQMDPENYTDPRFGPGKPGGAVPAKVTPVNLDLARAEDEAGLPRGTIRPATVAEKGSEVASAVKPAKVEPSDGNPDVRPAQVDRSATAELSPEEWARQKSMVGADAVPAGMSMGQYEAGVYGEPASRPPVSDWDVTKSVLTDNPITNALSSVGRGIGGALNAAGEALFPTPPKTRYADPLDAPPTAQPTAVAPMPGTPPAQPPVAPPGAPGTPGAPTPGSTKTGVSVATKGGGGGGNSDLERMAKEIADTTQRGLEMQADAEARGFQAKADIRAQAIHDDLMRQADYERTQRDMQERVNTQMSKYQEAVDAFKQMANEKIDPNRYWSHKSTGQKVAATIAGAMFGFTGQGMQWLQRLDGLVEQDIRAQSADLANKREALGAAMTGQQNLVNMARQAGMDGLAAINTARSMAWANVEEQLKLVADNTSSELVKANAFQGIAVARQKQAEFTLRVRSETQENAARWAAINIQRQAAAAKANTPGKQREVSPTLIKQYTTTLNMIESLKKMRELAKSSGLGERMVRGAKEVLTDEENAKKKQYEALQFQIARDRAGSSLQKPEQEALLPLLAARSGYYDPVPAIDQAIDMATKHLNNEVMGAQSGTLGDLTPVVEKLKSLEAENAGNSVGFTE